MHYYEVAPNQIVRLNSDFFTYSSSDLLPVGQIVLIEVGKKQIIGVILRQTNKPEYPTKSILSIVEQTPLPTHLVGLALWLSDYYLTPLALVLQTILPNGLLKKRRQISAEVEIVKRQRTNILFNTEQTAAINTLSSHKTGTFLLHGVTGSGKTEIYINLAKRTIASGKSVIVLVPEIALTSQLISEFSNHFDNLLVSHSRMSESARHLVWQSALNSSEPQIVIGPRSALFTPFKNIGAIIIDEAHEPSYKQELAPKYSALRAATVLGRLSSAIVVFGSATPNITDYFLAEHSDNSIIELTRPARVNSISPTISLVDMTKKNNFVKHRFLSNQLLEQITKTLDNNEQILIFHNRRGSTSTTLCKKCGWIAECPNCHLPLTLHIDEHSLRCHICNYNIKVMTSCPVCGSADIIHRGIGTKLIESELQKLFPNANIARFDADNDVNETVNARYNDLYKGIIDIAIGTQVVAKGLDLPHLRTVGIVQADTGLALPDFNASERTFQLIAQVVGRVGRDKNQTQVVVQTYRPTDQIIISGLNQDYKSFYNYTIEERRRSLFPPFTYLLKLTCSYKTEAASIKNAKKIANEISQKVPKDVKILGPTPAFYERLHGDYRWQLVLKSPKREYLKDVLKSVPSSHWQFELDPTSLL